MLHYGWFYDSETVELKGDEMYVNDYEAMKLSQDRLNRFHSEAEADRRAAALSSGQSLAEVVRKLGVGLIALADRLSNNDRGCHSVAGGAC